MLPVDVQSKDALTKEIKMLPQSTAIRVWTDTFSERNFDSDCPVRQAVPANALDGVSYASKRPR